MEPPHIVIEGIGSIGGVVAGLLIRAGHRCTLVTGNDAITEAISRDGLQVASRDEEFIVHTDAVTRLDDLASETRFSMAFLIMQAYGVADAAVRTAPWLTDDGLVVTFQNGIVEDAVGEAIGKARVVPATVAWGATMHEPGVVERTSAGPTIVGELDGPVTPRIEALGAVLAQVGEARLSGNMRGVLWTKLALNCTDTTLGAVLGQTIGELLENKTARRISLDIFREVVDTARAASITLETVIVNPDMFYLPRDAGWFAAFRKDVLMRLLGYAHRDVKPSMLQALERGRRTEIDYLNGYVVKQAEALGVDVPLNRRLTELVQEIEAGTRTYSPDNLDDLVAVR